MRRWRSCVAAAAIGSRQRGWHPNMGSQATHSERANAGYRVTDSPAAEKLILGEVPKRVPQLAWETEDARSGIRTSSQTVRGRPEETLQRRRSPWPLLDLPGGHLAPRDGEGSGHLESTAQNREGGHRPATHSRTSPNIAHAGYRVADSPAAEN